MDVYDLVLYNDMLLGNHAKKSKDIFRLQSIASYYCHGVSSVEKYFVKTKSGLIFCNIMAVLIRSLDGWQQVKVNH